MDYKYDNKGFNLIALLIIVLNILNLNNINAQNVSNFPQSWIGTWKGTMEIFNGPNKVQSIPMQLQLLRTDSINIFSYNIIYGQDTIAGKRAYQLKIQKLIGVNI